MAGWQDRKLAFVNGPLSISESRGPVKLPIDDCLSYRVRAAILKKIRLLTAARLVTAYDV